MPTKRKTYKRKRKLGKLIEFPRRLEWKCVETYIGRVAGTELHARVEGIPGDEEGRVRWQIYLGPSLISFGTADGADEGMEEARAAMEDSAMVVRPLGGDNTSGGSTNDER